MLKHLKMFTKDDIMKAMEKASQGHRQKVEVRRMLDGMDEYAEKVLFTIADGSYKNRIEYRELKLTGYNGKCREILSPSLYTRVLQIAWMQAVMLYYQKHDPMTGLNCKEGCGITASVKNKSILHRLKHVMWASYYGLLVNADGFRLMTKIEKDMKLQELSARIRIDRKMDAQKIDVRDLADNATVFTIHDYEIRRDREGRANWIKCLIGIEEAETGRMLAREFHGNYSCIIEAMEKWEEAFGRDQMIPIEDVTIENQCGYIFHGSTNQIKYIDEYEHQQSDCA